MPNTIFNISNLQQKTEAKMWFSGTNAQATDVVYGFYRSMPKDLFKYSISQSSLLLLNYLPHIVSLYQTYPDNFEGKLNNFFGSDPMLSRMMPNTTHIISLFKFLIQIFSIDEIIERSKNLHKNNLKHFITTVSKLGILWALNNGSTVNFLLDGINFADCFRGTEKHKYTYEELKFIYRYRNEFKQFFTNGRLNFYCSKEMEDTKQLTKVAPPWETQLYIDITSMYKPKLKNKARYAAFFSAAETATSDSVNEEQYHSLLNTIEVIKSSPY